MTTTKMTTTKTSSDRPASIARKSDDDIRAILADSFYWSATCDFWEALMAQTDDEALLKELREWWFRAYHRELCQAGM